MLKHFSHILEEPIDTTQLLEQEVDLLSQIINNTIPARSELFEKPKEPKWSSIIRAYIKVEQDNEEVVLLDILNYNEEQKKITADKIIKDETELKNFKVKVRFNGAKKQVKQLNEDQEKVVERYRNKGTEPKRADSFYHIESDEERYTLSNGYYRASILKTRMSKELLRSLDQI